MCDEQLEADRDLTYDEATDPLANTSGSSTAELESSTLDIEPCTIKTTITSNNADQNRFLSNGSVYYPEVIGISSIRLFESFSVIMQVLTLLDLQP